MHIPLAKFPVHRAMYIRRYYECRRPYSNTEKTPSPFPLSSTRRLSGEKERGSRFMLKPLDFMNFIAFTTF